MPTTTYAHFRDVPESAWRWPSFSPAEIACRGTGAIKINSEAMDKLQFLRNRLGKPLIVRSGYRSPSHNRAVGGAPASKHMLGTAFDIAMSNHDPVAFAEAARAVGNQPWRIALRHVLPNTLPPIMVQATLAIASAVIAEASLSFLGLGQQPPAPSWGSMLNTAKNYVEQAPWMAIWPGASIFLLVLSFNILGDGLRDALDPRQR